MDKREELYDLATVIHTEYLDEALAALRELVARVPLYALEDAPYEDEGISEHEQAIVDAALARMAGTRDAGESARAIAG